MGFKAQEAVSALDWDFNPWVKARGTTPEPSNREITTFIRDYNLLLESVRRTQLAKLDKAKSEINESEEVAGNREQELARWAEMSWEQGLEALEAELEAENQGDGEELALKLAEMVAKVAHDTPTVDQIMGLPGRIRAAYFGWFVGQMRPEHLTGVTG